MQSLHSPALPFSLLLLLAAACDGGDTAERGPIGAADSLGSCAAGDFCGGQSDGNCWCDEECVAIGDCCEDRDEICFGDATESVDFEVAGYIVGESLGNRADAETSWAAACTAWVDELGNQFGAPVSTECGEPENRSSLGFLFVSRPRAVFSAEIPAGTALAESPTGRTVAGASLGNLADALASWSAACTDAVAGLRAVYGDRLLAAACPEPTNLSSLGFLFESSVTVWLKPISGDPVSGTGYAVGGSFGNLADGLASWRVACEEAIALAFELSGPGRVVSATCGERENRSSLGFLFASEVALTFAGDDPVASSPPPITGASLGNLADALASWGGACEAQLRAARESNGDRHVGGACGVPENRSSLGFQFESQPTVWLTR
jgi:hypothetical protein